MLANCSKHFTDESLRRAFSGQDIEAAHEHFDVTACELLRSAQSLLRTIAFDCNADEVRRQLDQFEISRGRTSRLAIVDTEGSKHLTFRRDHGVGPRGAQPML